MEKLLVSQAVSVIGKERFIQPIRFSQLLMEKVGPKTDLEAGKSCMCAEFCAKSFTSFDLLKNPMRSKTILSPFSICALRG